ncbi:hypothetical protein A2U01_0115651, partial [Trifolium medium]|nr:hypothetical protein [Trifolium medium]
MVKEKPEKQRAEEVEPLTQSPEKLSRPPVSTPLPEFENGKNG